MKSLLIVAMLDMFSAEMSNLADSSRSSFRLSIEELAYTTQSVVEGSISWKASNADEPPIFSDEIDVAMLIANAYQECRFLTGSLCRDGDPAKYDKHENGKRIVQYRSVGPQQINKGFAWTLQSRDSYWEGLTVEHLRDTSTNIEVAYSIFKTVVKDCQPKDMAHLFMGYISGKCHKNSRVNKQAWLRCKMAKELLYRNGFEGTFTCGHENVDISFSNRFRKNLKWMSSKMEDLPLEEEQEFAEN